MQVKVINYSYVDLLNSQNVGERRHHDGEGDTTMGISRKGNQKLVYFASFHTHFVLIN